MMRAINILWQIGIHSVILLLLCGPMGCEDAAGEARARDERERMTELNRQVSDAHVRIEELRNRVILLEESLEQFVLSGRHAPPQNLKKVKLVPQAETGQNAPKAPKQLTSSAKNGRNNSVREPAPVLISNWDGASARRSKPAAASLKHEGMIHEYEVALALYRAKDYMGAIRAFSEFERGHPNTAYTDNAVFWMGMAFFEQSEWNLAVAEFERLEGFKQSNKHADALYYRGQALMKLGDVQGAQAVWNRLLTRFPQSEAAGRRRIEAREKTD